MNNRYEQAYQAATQYYLQGETMQSIARGLDVSRSTVSRLLAEARESGLVRISIADAAGSQSPTSRALADAFGITVHLVPVRATSSLPTRIEQVAQRAANLLADVVSDNQVIGVAWGVTIVVEPVWYTQPAGRTSSMGRGASGTAAQPTLRRGRRQLRRCDP